ncbi:MAG: AAA family ATPase [Methanobrevibacter sp.]|nr:AAA family ATPase [Methanobrevibacter sp.]
MGLPVLVIGESGSGKTYSLKNFEPAEVSIFSVEKARLPFQKKLPLMAHAKYADINKTLASPNKKAYVIDDSQYLLVNEMFDGMQNGVNSFDLFKKLAMNFRNLVHYINDGLPDDVIVYFLHHTEQDKNTGKLTAKTVGKMLNDVLTIEGCFDIVLWARLDGLDHIFQTQNDGMCSCKSPEGMFDKIIPNDLKAVDSRIREYYGYNTTPAKTNKKGE